jgi:mannitol/fructose-specific phosphotransferase system IIA component
VTVARGRRDIGRHFESAGERLGAKDMETQKQIFGLVERDLTRGVYIGKIIGFPHIEFEATTFGDVVSKLQAHTAELVNSESMVLESDFVGVIRL